MWVSSLFNSVLNSLVDRPLHYPRHTYPVVLKEVGWTESLVLKSPRRSFYHWEDGTEDG